MSDPSPSAAHPADEHRPGEETPTGSEKPSAAEAHDLEPLPLDTVSPQFTLRAVLTGMVLGGLLSMCNVYAGLKIGWGFNMSITAALLSYGFWMSLHALSGKRIRPWGILENNVNQTACSSGASVSSAGLVAPIPALAMITGESLDWHFLALWCFSVMMVGITVAIAIRQQMLIRDRLPFAFGIASAETLKEMYARGSEAVRRVVMLICAAIAAGGVKFVEEVRNLRPYIGALGQVKLHGFNFGAYTFGLQPSLLFYGVGGLIGFRAGWSLLLGAGLAFGVVAPAMIDSGKTRLSVAQPLSLLPPEIDPAEDFPKPPNGYLRYDPARYRLEYKGQMKPEDLARYAALSDDRFYNEALHKLYLASQLDIARGEREISEFSTTRRIQISEPLTSWPEEFIIPRRYGEVLRYNATRQVLVSLGPLTDTARAAVEQRLGEYSGKPEYASQADAVAELRAALSRLAAREPASFIPSGAAVPTELQGALALDPAGGIMHLSRPLTTDEADALASFAQRVEDPDFGTTLAALRSGAQLNLAGPNYVDILYWVLWPGVTLMVVSALVSFSFSWRSIVASVTGFRRGGAGASASAQDTGEVSRKTFIAAMILALILSVILQISFFEIVFWAAILGVLFSFALALVAARVSGETSITPVGAMGKVTQLIFGVLIPNNPAPNLMTANVTGGAASQCADLLHDLKCGWLLGASPKLQSLAQVCGAFAGALAGSAVYLVLVQNPAEQLLTEDWPAPAVAAWKAVAELFMVGLEALPEGTPLAMLIAAVVGVILPVLEKLAPRAGRAFVPSAASIGLAFVVPADYSVSMFVGALAALLVSRWLKHWAARFLVAICAGLVAGDTLTGVGFGLYASRHLVDTLIGYFR